MSRELRDSVELLLKAHLRSDGLGTLVEPRPRVLGNDPGGPEETLVPGKLRALRRS